MSLTKVTNSMISGASVSPFDYMTAAQIADVQARTRTLDVSAPVQAAVDYAWANGKAMWFPAGDYKAKIVTPPTPAEPRGLAFIMQGEGAGSPYLGGGSYVKGTTVVSPDTSPVLTVDNILTPSDSGPTYHIRDIRFEGNSVNPVLALETFNDFCTIRNCTVYQNGIGGGIAITRGYGGTIEHSHVVNTNLIGTTTATGSGIDVGTPYSGALLTLYKVSSRGWNVGFNLGTGSGNYILNTTLQECECAWNNYGILVNALMRKTVINECYFESIAITSVQDHGDGTTVSNCMMFEGPTWQIRNNADTRGNLYFGNYIQLSGPNQTGVVVQSSGDALGYSKTVRDNFIYFLSSGGTVAGVVGIEITGTNPVVSIQDNTFRPRRSWIGGAGTVKILNSSTGYLTGTIPITDSLNEFPVLSNVGISLSTSGSTLTHADVSAGVMTLPVDSSFNVNNTTVENITALALGTGVSRIVILNIYATNVAVLKKGTYMVLASDFPTLTAGSLLLNVITSGGSTYAFELARALY